MKVSYKQIITAQVALSELAKTKLAVKESVKLARLIKAFSDEFEIYNQERLKLCEEYGKLDKKEDVYHFDNDNIKIFEEKMKELEDMESETDFEKIKILSDIEIEPAMVLACEDFIEFGE